MFKVKKKRGGGGGGGGWRVVREKEKNKAIQTFYKQNHVFE